MVNLTPERLSEIIKGLVFALKNNTNISIIPEDRSSFTRSEDTYYIDTDEVFELIDVSQQIFANQPIHLELEAPIKICGDIHGQAFDLVRLFEASGFPPTANYLFLGDYVDRGPKSIECLVILLCYKVLFPENFFMLRGNHESSLINRTYGFYDECRSRYGISLFNRFNELFNYLPFSAVIDEKIFCCHGGLSPGLLEPNGIENIKEFSRPGTLPDQGIHCDLVWADPKEDTTQFVANDRGVSYTFSADVVKKFLAMHNFDLVCRAHQVVQDGFAFFAHRQLVTIFSAPNYCGEYANSAAVMSVDENLLCSFQVFKAAETVSDPRTVTGRSGTPPRC